MIKIIFTILVIVFSLVPATGQSGKQVKSLRIAVQPSTGKISQSDLLSSSEIVSERLKSFGIEGFEVKVMPEKNQLEVILADERNLDYAIKLSTNKGVLEFYETWNREEISGMLDAEKLSSLLESKAQGNLSAELGCTSAGNTGKVNDFLRTTGQDNKCRFLWNDLFGKSEICLYAVKTGKGKGALLRGSDIGSIRISKDAPGNVRYIDLRFKQPAAVLWAEITKANIGRSIAIVLDDKVLIAPVLKSVISGGNCQISGNFSEADLKYIVAMGSIGELKSGFTLMK